MKVPAYDTPQAAPSPFPQVRVSAAEGRNYTGGQLQQLGNAMSNTGDHILGIAADMQQEANQTVAKTIDTQAVEKISSVLYDPQNGYLIKQGGEAIAAYNDAAKQLETVKRDALSAVQSPSVRRILEPVLNARVQSAFETLDRHSGTETRRYQGEAANSRAVASMKDAAFNYQDDKRFAEAVQVAGDETAALTKLNGWDGDTARLHFQKYVDVGYKMRYDAWQVKDPLTAFAHFQNNSDYVSPDMREQMGRGLFLRAAPIMAEEVIAARANHTPTPEGFQPLGVENNNPGNLMKPAHEGGADSRYYVFSKPEDGISAMTKALVHYGDQGIDTVEGIISRWAAATQKDPVKYIATVSSEMGVKRDEKIDLHDFYVLEPLIKSMITVENGKQPYTDEQIAEGMYQGRDNPSAPLQVGPSRPQQRTAMSGVPLVDALPEDWRLHVMQLADSKAKQGMHELRDALHQRVTDSTAEYWTNGAATNPPRESEFVAAYGQIDGVRMYRDFAHTAASGRALQQFKTLPTSSINSVIENAKPAPGEGFAKREQDYRALLAGAEQVKKAREQDPVAFATEFGNYGFKPLEDVNALGEELPRRVRAAAQISQDYGTKPVVFSKWEAQTLSEQFKREPVEWQKGFFQTLYTNTGNGDLYRNTMQQLAPNNPTIAVAGMYAAEQRKTTQGRDVSEMILRGQQALTPPTGPDGKDSKTSLVKMPPDKDMLNIWVSETGTAFKGREQADNLFMQTARAIYAAQSVEDGDYSGVMNAKRWKSAIALSTGGIERHNGEEIVMPYGLDYGQFQDRLREQADGLVKSGRVSNTSSREVMHLPLESFGDGKYLVRRGAGYMVDTKGQPVILEISNRAAQ